MKLIRVLAVAGPVVFTLDWLLLGASHQGYDARAETISALSAHNAHLWGLMAAGQLAFALALLAVAVAFVRAMGRRGLPTAVLLALSASGTIQLTVFRTICTHTDAGWCTPLPHAAYPHQQWAHGVGAGIAFVSLHLACLTAAAATWRLPSLRTVALVALAAELIALPALIWFVTNADTSWHGFAEKLFLTALATFVAYSGLRLGSPATRSARATTSEG